MECNAKVVENWVALWEVYCCFCYADCFAVGPLIITCSRKKAIFCLNCWSTDKSDGKNASPFSQRERKKESRNLGKKNLSSLPSAACLQCFSHPRWVFVCVHFWLHGCAFLCLMCVLYWGFKWGHLKGTHQQQRWGCLRTSWASAGMLLWRRQQLWGPINKRPTDWQRRKWQGQREREERPDGCKRRDLLLSKDRAAQSTWFAWHVFLGEETWNVAVAHSLQYIHTHQYISHALLRLQFSNISIESLSEKRPFHWH